MEDNIIYKFKVGDIVTGTKENQWIYARKSEITKAYKNKFGRNSYNILGSVSEWYEDELKLVENKEYNKMEKTFREVIADIKEGEVWECRSKYIQRFADGIQIYHKEKGKSTPSMLMRNNDKFKLQRKEYTFAEAFKAYEEGKEIESCYSQYKYKKEGGLDLYSKTENEWYGEDNFEIDEIRGKWYIN